mmetsp:Transcript_38239/g.100146  ORF Transcript_38239/g.100146 Transcript_38239/m.100146 type:complete len:119 (-) Transcript_38239:72-428(-)
MSFCCTGVRWADTARMAGWFTFWVAIALMAVVEFGAVFGLLGWVMFTAVGMYFRQKTRVAFGMENGGATWCIDCLCYAFCCCCAVAQEAQQYEDAWSAGHPVAKAVALERQEEPRASA